MTFDEILDQVITLLQRQGRVSYPALKIRFSLDDEYLEALKAEIIEAQQLATDENGRVLVWAGNTAGTSAAAPPPAQSPSQPSAQQEPPSQVASLLAPRSPEAERRQLTVMFIDLVGSTALASQLDPEDYRDVVRAYQAACTEIIQRYDGHVAQLLGDGVLVYFGYPHAHEDDAQRAIHTGLGIIEAIEALNSRLEQDTGIMLAVRLGIHTGRVVVGTMGSEGRQEKLALGEIPNLAARLQGLAAPNTIIISSSTYRLVQGYFECQELGEHTLRGVAEPIAVYRVLGDSGAQSRLEVASTRGLTPLVGRDSEVTLLLERWEQAKGGHGQVVLLTGEGGIGKSRLVQVLKDHVARAPHTRSECRSSPYYQNTALYPLIDFFQRALRWHQGETPEAKLTTLEQQLRQYRFSVAEMMSLFAPLLSLPLPEDRYPPLPLSPQRQRQKTLETLVAILLQLAECEPVLFILEDLHWTDPTTLEFLALLVEQIPTASLYTLLTCRPEFQPSWSHRSYLTEITVNRLSRNQIERMATQVAGGKALPREIREQLVDKTDGVPLFVEEMTKAMVESGTLQEGNGQYDLVGSVTSLAIPTTLQDSLMARLDRLVTAKAVAQFAAVIGRQFAYELLATVSHLDAATLQRELGRLVEAEIVYQRGVPPHASYLFKHALIQDAAYQSLLKSTRQQYHQRIAQVLEAQCPESAAAQPELVAHHCTEAGLLEQTIAYWYKAGQRAIERSAHMEAINHLRQGLALLQTLPETPERVQRDVDLHITLGASLLATKGHAAPEVGEAYTYARQRCEHLGDPHRLFPVLRGLWNYYNVRAELQTAHALGEQLLTLAQHAQDAAMLPAAHRALGSTLLWLGEFASSHPHFAQGIALYDSTHHRASAFRYGEDMGVTCRSLGTRTLWCLGYPDQGRTQSHEAVTLAQQLAHPFSLNLALCSAATLYQLRREVRAAQERAETAISLATEQGFPFWIAIGSILRGWALVQQGQTKEGIAQMQQSLTAHRATGAELDRPYLLALLADAYGTIGQAEAGLTALAEALTVADTTGERFYEPERYRLKGALLLQQSLDNQVEAESCLQQAIAIAQNQQAKSLELRATTSLARLWQQQGKRQEAHDLLAPVYHWFTEGFDTADLKDAKVLLDA